MKARGWLALVAIACATANAQVPDAGSDAGSGSAAGPAAAAPGSAAAAPGSAAATPGSAAAAETGSGSGSAQPQFEPPRALGDTSVPFPPGAPAITAPVVVTVKLRIDKTGAVVAVTPVTPPQPPFDDAVAAAAKQFQFDPGRFGGKPVTVEVTFTHTFVPTPVAPPPTTAADTGPARTAVLRGKLVELGTRAAVQNATVTATIAGRTYSVDADATGHFRLELPPGDAQVEVHAAAHDAFVQQEKLGARQELAVTYLVARDRYDPYEIVVVSDQRREEVSRITLTGAEIKQVPGTFGDPFRVIQTLPGVANIVSLLPFPVVRGSSPSSTGFLVDGVEVPLLFHLLAGPSVIHPEFIDSVDFYPGGAPVPYGGYTGGIIDGRTSRAGSDAHLIDVDANLLEAGGLVREPIAPIDATMTAAARYGYPGYLIGLATNQISLSYWDYQFRLDGGTKANGWTVFAYGARDELDTVAANANPNAANPPLTPELILEFDRLDLRYHQTTGELETTYRIVGGYDKTFSGGIDFSILDLNPQIRSRYKPDPTLELQAGVDGDARKLDQGSGADAAANPLTAITSQLSDSYSASAFFEGIWRPTTDWMIRPGIRGDVWTDNTATKDSADPRLTVRYKLGTRDLADAPPDSDDSAVWLKGSVGEFHQPPRFVLPLPGLDEMPLKYGLQRAIQTELGVEVPLEHRIDLSTTGFFNYMDPTVFDLETNALSVGTSANSSVLPTTIVSGNMTEQQTIQRLTTPELGRAYGLEFMLRRKAKSGLFGWISYTLSRSERYMGGWLPYDYDRTQLLNGVVGLPLRRNWDVGLRVAYESGLPETTTYGYNAGREDGYWQFDIRVDKRAVYRKWLLDFYVDITNVALLPEEVTPGTTLRYVLPTAGIRGRL